jgi:acetyl esterase/lipase
MASDIDVKPLIAPSLLAPLDFLPPQLSNITRDSVDKIRRMMAPMVKPKGIDGVTVTQKKIHTQEGDLTLYIYQKDDCANSQPALLWMHGGGYIMGSADTDFAAAFAQHCDTTVISVEYRLAPEHPFPAAHNDCHAAYLWLHEHAQELGVDATRIAVGGESAGAGLAAGLVLRNRDEQGPDIAFQFLLYPMLDNLHATHSGAIEEYPIWNRRTSLNAWEMYLNGTPGAQASAHAAPARAKDVSGLPNTYLTVGAVDLLRDEAIEYAQRLMAAGVPTQLAVYPGLYHGAELMVPDAAISREMTSAYVAALKNALHPL